MDCSTGSPDLNPIKHSRDMVGRDVQASDHHPRISNNLKRSIREELDNIPKNG